MNPPPVRPPPLDLTRYSPRHRQARWRVHDEAAGPRQLPVVHGHPQTGESGRHRGEDGLQLDPSQTRSEAEMRPVPERHVSLVAAARIEHFGALPGDGVEVGHLEAHEQLLTGAYVLTAEFGVHRRGAENR